MLEPLFESATKGDILLYLHTHHESYAREIARDLGLYPTAVRYHLLKLEKGGVLYSKLKGFKKELEALLEKSLSFIPEAEKERLYKPRLRPRRTGKPLS
jgi:predicted ArsR family transcriptional regulator